MRFPEVKDVCPVPPPPTVSVPLSDGVKVWVLPEPTIVRAEVRPLVVEVVVARVTVGPEDVCPVGPSAVMPEELPQSEPLTETTP